MAKDNIDGHQADFILVSDDEAFSEALTVLFVLEQLTVAAFRSAEALPALREVQAGCIIVHCEADGLALKHFEEWYKPTLAVILISTTLPSDYLLGVVSVMRPPVDSLELIRVVRGACREHQPSSNTAIAGN